VLCTPGFFGIARFQSFLISSFGFCVIKVIIPILVQA
jgi:hypothetical protein